MSQRITNKCYANFHYLSYSRRQYWCLISIQIDTFNFDCILFIVYQSISKFIWKTERLAYPNMCRNIFCSLDEIIAVNGINGWMNFDQCQNWIISILTNIINHHHHHESNRTIDNPWKDIHSYSFGSTSILTSINAFDLTCLPQVLI